MFANSELLVIFLNTYISKFGRNKKGEILIELIGYIFKELAILKDDTDELETVSKLLDIFINDFQVPWKYIRGFLLSV